MPKMEERGALDVPYRASAGEEWREDEEGRMGWMARGGFVKI